MAGLSAKEKQSLINYLKHNLNRAEENSREYNAAVAYGYLKAGVESAIEDLEGKSHNGILKIY
ncbi:MAG: hypothetical protein A3F72_03095 [Bacteroidetes bacterium RIFCSPLOWO2_12_FULL_35_15]|nr:MAG: hypothetical protein A3F72_03095 [Bacteroidetes bacterium RIFCSPLOWO2_12_FULL_35_15]